MEDEVLDYLEHYGVLGMKWGVIKGPGKISKAGKSTKEIKKAGKQKASDYKISKKAARKNIGINSYKEITKGRDIATKTLKAASNFVVGPYVAKYVTQPLIEGKYK